MSFQRQFRTMDPVALEYFGRRETETRLLSDGWTVTYHDDLGERFMIARKDGQTRVILVVAEKFSRPDVRRLRGRRAVVQQVAKELGGTPQLGLLWIEETGPQVEFVDAKTLQTVA
jgi:hypothetical protein